MWLYLVHAAAEDQREFHQTPPTLPEQEVAVLYVAADVDAKQIGDGVHRSAPLGPYRERHLGEIIVMGSPRRCSGSPHGETDGLRPGAPSGSGDAQRAV